ncbi:MAG: hypothetical protein ACTSRZ_12555 [Promethearchaeota archaeon]
MIAIIRETIFQNSTWDENVQGIIENGYVRGMHLIAWVIAIALMYISVFVFISRSKKKELIISQVWIFRSFALFFGLMGITRILFVFAYYIEPWYNFFLATAYAFGALSLLPIVFVLEKWLIRWSRRIFTIIGIILNILSFYYAIFNVQQSATARLIQQIGMPFLALAFLILYLFLIKNSVGVVRKKAILTLFGMVVFVVGILLDSEQMLFSSLESPYFIFLLYISPIVFSLGIILIVSSQKIS